MLVGEIVVVAIVLEGFICQDRVLVGCIGIVVCGNSFGELVSNKLNRLNMAEARVSWDRILVKW